MNVREIKRCRACQSDNLTTVLELGNLAVSDFPPAGTDPAALDRAPLELVRCGACTLVQLRHTVDRDRLYRKYWYRSGVNGTMIDALRDVATDAAERVSLKTGDAILDIGCNDGTLLRCFPTVCRRIGFDPSDVAREAWLANDFEYDLVRDFFPTTRQHTPVKCKIVTAIACFYDLDDPNGFLSEVKRWLHPEGVLVLQFQDLGSMYAAAAVDNVCHEHLCYYDLLSLAPLLQRHDLGMVGYSYHAVNGGSLRVTVKHGGGVFRDGDPPDWADFALRVNRARSDTLGLLHRLWAEEATVYGIAASTKFNTLSQYYGLDRRLITAIGERSPAKWGKQTVTGIPIVSEDEMRAARPDYLFVCAYQFADAFAERERVLLEAGTKLIVPLPELRIVGAEALAKEVTLAGLPA